MNSQENCLIFVRPTLTVHAWNKMPHAHTSKNVLLCHLERNKVVIVPIDKTKSDWSYQRKDFLKALNYVNNIYIDIT